MQPTRNVLRDTEQAGYPVDFARMFRRASNLIPMAEAIEGKYQDACAHTLETFYRAGLYYHLDDNSPTDAERESVYQTLAMWGASLVRFVSEVTVVDCAWIHSQGEDFDLKKHEREEIPVNCGILVLTRPPKWDKDDELALFVDRLLWGRKGRATFATIISGSLKKYPHLTPTLSSSLTNLDESLRNYDPDTGHFSSSTPKKAPKRR